MKRSLIINADDFGLCASVNKAIVECYKAGNLTSTTMMANMPGLQDAAELAKTNPGLAIGLHFNLTEGNPLLEASTLKDDTGVFFSRGELIKRTLKKSISKNDIQQEFLAQWEKIESFGITISHVDSHQHTHTIPFVFEAIKDLVKERNVPIRTVRPPQPDLVLAVTNPLKYAKQIVNRKRSTAILNSGLKTNGELVSIHDLAELPSIAPYSDLVLQTEAPVVELMVHPYIMSEGLKQLYPSNLDDKMPFIQKCFMEHAWLAGPALFGDFDLLTYRDIA